MPVDDPTTNASQYNSNYLTHADGNVSTFKGKTPRWKPNNVVYAVECCQEPLHKHTEEQHSTEGSAPLG